MIVKKFGENVFDFYQNLSIDTKLPESIEVMNPHKDENARIYTKKFLDKYFSDRNERVLMFGINPGRFGAGITGVTFTDPVALETHCHIPNPFPKVRELSAEFIYEVIREFGGAEAFYKKFFLTAVSPLGFIKAGINYNYYDDKNLEKAVTPFIIDSIKKQIEIGGRRDIAILIGTGKNQKYFLELNKTHNFFQKVEVVEHPRFIMQYKRKTKNEYIEKYIDLLLSV